jgi:hypothetical protein
MGWEAIVERVLRTAPRIMRTHIVRTGSGFGFLVLACHWYTGRLPVV